MLNFPSKLLSALTRYEGALRRFCSETVEKQVENVKTKLFSVGQPTYESHPHLLNEGEITPLIQKSEYQERRQRLIDSIVCNQSMTPNKDVKQHLVVIPSASKQYMSDKIPYVFRQNSDFLYLSGCQEPDTCLVLETTGSADQFYSTLFLRDKDKHSELWDGPRTDPSSAVDYFGVDQGLPMSELDKYIGSYLKTYKNCTFWYEYMHPIQSAVQKIMSHYLAENTNPWDRPMSLIHKLRLVKSTAEVALMQQACNITAEAFKQAIACSQPGTSEHKLFAQIDYECRMRGAEFLAYPPVIAGGNRANIIHYIHNDQIVLNGEMVLVDAGCEYHGYSADITRTWPVSGKFTPAQQMMYEVVLNVQNDVIRKCAEFPTLDKLLDEMYIVMGRRLQDIGLISPNARNIDVYKAVQEFCPHHVSHYLGMDVHDTPSVPRNIRLQPGMVITIEPGIYIDKKRTKVPKEYRGMGIRIEDDVLITESGPIILSKNCPTTIDDIERIAAHQDM